MIMYSTTLAALAIYPSFMQRKITINCMHASISTWFRMCTGVFVMQLNWSKWKWSWVSFLKTPKHHTVLDRENFPSNLLEVRLTRILTVLIFFRSSKRQKSKIIRSVFWIVFKLCHSPLNSQNSLCVNLFLYFRNEKVKTISSFGINTITILSTKMDVWDE